MLVFGDHFKSHRPWAAFAGLVTLAAIGWYGWEASRQPDWPGGSSVVGFTLGVVAAGLMVFECLLWVRKKVRAWRLGPVRVWLRAHIWLGLLTVPLVVLHCGFALGGSLTTALMILFAVVIVSGVWGLAVQQILPGRMLAEVPAETIATQIDAVMEHQVAEAERLIALTCGITTVQLLTPVDQGFLTVGTVKSEGTIRGRVLETRTDFRPVPESELLERFYVETVRPYLLGQRGRRSPLAQRTTSRMLFTDLRGRLAPDAHEAVAVLENLAEQRRQLDAQARMHFWLHNWLLLHVPLSAALMILLAAHIWAALKYW